MSVYVDTETTCMPKGRYRWNRVSHLFADTVEELHTFAQRIGLKREWFQDKPKLRHYDLNPTRRVAAVRAGVVELDRPAAVAKWRELRGAVAR